MTDNHAPFPEDRDDYTETDHTEAEVTGSKSTVAFFADSRASEIALAQTVKALIEANDIQLGLVELSSLVGVTVAAEFLRAGVPYQVLSFGPDTPELSSKSDYDPQTPASFDDAGHLFAHSSGIQPVEADQLHLLDANFVLIPAISGAGTKRIDLALEQDPVDVGDTTLPGHMLRQFETLPAETRRALQVLYVDVPERGLVQELDGSYQRRVLSLDFTEPAEKG